MRYAIFVVELVPGTLPKFCLEMEDADICFNYNTSLGGIVYGIINAGDRQEYIMERIDASDSCFIQAYRYLMNTRTDFKKISSIFLDLVGRVNIHPGIFDVHTKMYPGAFEGNHTYYFNMYTQNQDCFDRLWDELSICGFSNVLYYNQYNLCASILVGFDDFSEYLKVKLCATHYMEYYSTLCVNIHKFE